MTVRKMREKRGWAFWLAVSIIKPTLLATTRRTWVDPERIPAEGGCVLVMNHLSHVDPLTAAHLVYDYGRLPHYLAKAGLWKNKALGRFLDAAGQIPVERERGGAGAYGKAVKAVREGRLIVVYPEATITRDPDLWPMRGKSGAARIALETACPVIPVGQWGAQEILPPYAKRPRLFPRRRITMRVGEPVPLDDLRDGPVTTEVVTEATDRIMAAITRQLELIREADAPAERYDMRVHGDRFKKRKDRS
ncbi:lysophospholipid acyltransferase family protein [Nocardioides sp. TF02-7]|uniref:lysophospholipid acyltransferase family protein n=1 Tax=Nocardioides sp. TF02-7 TaxID=2917724 RepID=UPI001F059FCD|nr:lysophospholipid acyltransferase family protein [Nocardioides sp. TF02-7]UMG93077.1 1-acyl-sn-glycerol-3-phosphate acyltransferase [Nocardioides sp. TF02-7]